MNRLLLAFAAAVLSLMPPALQAGEFRHGAYSASIPDGWKKIDVGASAPFPIDAYYDASGAFLPLTFKGAPVIVKAWIAGADGDTLEQARDRTIAGYTHNPGRVFENGFTHNEEKFRLKSGEDALLISTRFYRKDQGLNQSRFDLVMFPRSGKGITYTISVQYADPSYGFEDQFKLKDEVRKLYSGFEFRQ